jgi:hypothetical protein
MVFVGIFTLPSFIYIHELVMRPSWNSLAFHGLYYMNFITEHIKLCETFRLSHVPRETVLRNGY